MAFFFKSFPTCPTTTEPKTEVKSDTELVPEDCTAAETLELGTCEECGFQFFSDAYREDHKKWHKHLRSKENSSSAEPHLPTTERYYETSGSAVGIKTEKPNDDTTAGVTLSAMTCQPQNPLKPFACEYCGWRFILRKDLVHHIRTHTGEKPYACSDCDRHFARVHSLNLHRGRHNSSEEGKPYSCTRCPKRFWTKGCYMSHFKSNHEDWPRPQTATTGIQVESAAESCSAEDNQEPNGSLNINDTQHILYLPQSAGAASFDDDYTGNLQDRSTESNQVGALFSATPLGGGKRGVRFTCQYCGWGFWDKKDRKQHEWTHTGLKPYQCKECDKNFSRSYTLKLHMRAHAGEKPFSCQYCNKTFTGSGSLRLHNKIHTKVHKHKCPECPVSFKRMDLFKIHQKEHLGSNSGNFARLHSSCDTLDTSPSVQNEGVALHPVSLSLTLPVMQNASNNSIVMANDISNIHQKEHLNSNSGNFARLHSSCDTLDTSSSVQNEGIALHPVSLSLTLPVMQNASNDSIVMANDISNIHQKEHLNSNSGNFARLHSSCDTLDTSPSVQNEHSLVRHLRSHKKENLGLIFESYPAETDSEILAETRGGASKAKMIYESQTTVVTQESVDVQGTMQDIDGVIIKKSKDLYKRFKRPFRFKCSYCPRRFRDKKDWRQHDNTHTGFKPYSCSVCGRKLSRQYSLKKHMMTHTGEKPVSCSYCNKAFRNKSGLLCHQKKHHPWVFEHTCCLCKTAHKNTDALECHLRSDHDDVIRTVVNQFLIDDQGINAAIDSSCLSSPKQSGYSEQTNWADMEDIAVNYLSKRERRIDQAVAVAIDLWLKCEGCEMITEIPKFKCSFCDKGFQNRKDWERHENSHTGYKPYVCDICGKRISRLNSLKAHRLTHSITHTYVCRHCGKGFRKQLSLVKHEASENCTSLGTKFKTITSEPNKTMADHEDVYQNLNTDVEPLISLQEMDSAELDQSSSTFCSRDSISRMPSCSFQYQCAHCKWKFSDMDIFRRHGCWKRRLLGKTRKKQVSCDNCKDIFRTKKTLDVHLRTCRNVCNLCHESFTTNNALGRHLQLIHSYNTANQLNIKQEKSDTASECISAKTVCDTTTASDVPDLNSGRSSSIHHPDDAAISVLNPTTARMCLPVKIPVIKTRTCSKRLVITCRICQKNFTHRYALKLHLMMHASETRYQCRLCQKRFFYKKGLKKHLQNHRPLLI